MTKRWHGNRIQIFAEQSHIDYRADFPLLLLQVVQFEAAGSNDEKRRFQLNIKTSWRYKLFGNRRMYKLFGNRRIYQLLGNGITFLGIVTWMLYGGFPVLAGGSGWPFVPLQTLWLKSILYCKPNCNFLYIPLWWTKPSCHRSWGRLVCACQLGTR